MRYTKERNRNESIPRSAIKHFFIMIGVCILVSIGLYVINLSPAVTLHPNAYRDMIRSIVVIYGVFFLISTLTGILLNRYVIGDSDENEKFSFKELFDRITPYETIAIIFTLLTLANNIMMVTGGDIPKEGVFAYIHMMSRLAIITLIVGLISFKEIKERIKDFDFKKLFTLEALFGHKKDAFINISKSFTNVTILYCLTMILFQGAFKDLGGVKFYISLLVIAGIITLARAIKSKKVL